MTFDDQINNVSLVVDALMARVAELEFDLALKGEKDDEFSVALDASWVFSSAVLVVMMQVGFAMLEAGSVREHNVVATYTKNLLDVTLGVFAAACGGFQLAYPDEGDTTLTVDGSDEQHALRQSLFFHLAFQATAATIVSGAMAERTSLTGYLLFSVFMSGVIFSMAVRLTWGGGWLALMEPSFHDFAGSGVVHLVGGMSSFVGCAVVGPRIGRWDPVLSHEFQPHNVPSILMGTFFLWVGWYGFNPGSTGAMSSLENASAASNAFITTTYSGAAAGVAALFISLASTRFRSFDILSICNALLGGLVAITAGCDIIDPNYSLIVGVVAGFLYFAAVEVTKLLNVDDCVEATAVHGVCGAWGCIAVGLFHRSNGAFFGYGGDQLVTQLAGVGLLACTAIVPSFIFFRILMLTGHLRVSAEDEAKGLDAKLGLSAYAQRSTALAECASMVPVLGLCNHTPKECLEALRDLKKIIYRPFSPQAADNKLNGEMRDILDHLIWENGEELKYVGFLSHHKADGGEVARVFVDCVRRLLGNDDRPARKEILDRMDPENFIFLDTMNLKDLDKLMDYVLDCRNHILLLTRKVLERPWVLVEIIQAHKAGRNLINVMVEFRTRDSDPRQFRFPHDIDKVIESWKSYCEVLDGKKGNSGGIKSVIARSGFRKSNTSSNASLSDAPEQRPNSFTF